MLQAGRIRAVGSRNAGAQEKSAALSALRTSDIRSDGLLFKVEEIVPRPCREPFGRIGYELIEAKTTRGRVVEIDRVSARAD